MSEAWATCCPGRASSWRRAVRNAAGPGAAAAPAFPECVPLPEHLPHRGERFYRVDAARSAGTGGTGLGLAIYRSITAAHGGRLTLESQVGAGTAVRIRLLLCPPVKQA